MRHKNRDFADLSVCLRLLYGIVQNGVTWLSFLYVKRHHTVLHIYAKWNGVVKGTKLQSESIVFTS